MTHPYASEAYALSLSHLGAPLAAPEWGGHVLTRATPCGGRTDATGPYPLTVIAPGADLSAGLDRLAAAGLVSVVLVLDDRLRPPMAALEQAFDFARPFKSHFLYDRGLGPLELGKHHRYELRRAQARVSAAEIDLVAHGEAWRGLYGELAKRHGIEGLHAFPAAYHDALARLPGLRTFGAFIDGKLVSAHLFVVHEGYAISHLAASSAQGYDNGAAYAVNALAIAELDDCAVINFGGGAGLGDDPNDGLVRFKKGFSNAVAPSYLCGKVLDRAAYAALSGSLEATDFFPAYRSNRKREPSNEH